MPINIRRSVGHVALTDTEVDGGRRKIDFIEEHLRHAIIVMLTGMKEVFSMPGLPESPANRRSFDKLRSGSQDGDDDHLAFDQQPFIKSATACTTRSCCASVSSGKTGKAGDSSAARFAFGQVARLVTPLP